jgi:hypothetical protein
MGTDNFRIFLFKNLVVQGFSISDTERRTEFCNTFVGTFQKDNWYIETLAMSSEAHFEVRCYGNKQKKTLGISLSDPVTAFCGISRASIVPPHPFLFHC